MNKIVYRLATVSDAPELHKLNELFNDEGCNTISDIEDTLKNNSQEIVCVAAEGDTLVGFCCGQFQKSICYPQKTAEITELYVMEERRRLGIGKQLVKLLEGEFVRQGVSGVRVLTGEDNEEAQALYRSFGYELDPDEVMMDKYLKAVDAG